MSTPTTNERQMSAAQEMLQKAIELSEDYGEEVADAVRLAAEQPLDADTATRLYGRILEMLWTRGRDLDDDSRRQLAVEVQAEVTRLVASVPRPERIEESTTSDVGGLELCARHGLEPHDVVPVPTFNSASISLREGYVDVTNLPLWRGNHRVELYISEFRERNRREPDDDELLQLMHGRLDDLPSLRDDKDPFKIAKLADSIARKGIERPPIVTFEGEPKDGNRRISAAKYVLAGDQFTAEQKERARWIRVWRAPKGTTPDQFEAIVVALNFEDDNKEEWPEYVKGRLVAQRYRTLRDDVPGILTTAQDKRLRDDVAKTFAISTSDVLRYVRMVHWAEDFESYHVDERGLDPAAVRHKANDTFQRFYEIQAGKAGTKLTDLLMKDEDLRPLVYDLMYDVLDSGAQVRSLHNVVSDPAALKLLQQAHDEAEASRPDQSLAFVNEAIAEAKRKSPTKRLGFEQWLRGAVDRLGAASPEDWGKVSDIGLLTELRRLFPSAIGAIDGELAARGLTVPADENVSA